MLAARRACSCVGCGDAEHVYVADEDTGVFLQLPKDWTVFEVEDGNANVNPRTDASSGEWAVIIDGSERSRGAATSRSSRPLDPVGRASVAQHHDHADPAHPHRAPVAPHHRRQRPAREPDRDAPRRVL